MNTDCTFQIGKDHTVCEDYALAGTNKEFGFIIVCDGCSASPDVDFGARVLALAARETIFWRPANDCYNFADITIKEAHENTKRLTMLHPHCLDATLLVGWVHNKKATVYMYGDGVMVHRSKEEIKSVHIHLTSGAPDYLSYSLNNNRALEYDMIEENRKEVWTSFNGIHDYKPFCPFTYNSDVEEGDTISLISDGINSFRKSDNESIDWKDLIDEFTAFKNFEGVFVHRRINAFKRKCAKEGINHLDDISVASIVI